MVEKNKKEGREEQTATLIPLTDYFNRPRSWLLIILVASTLLLIVIGFGFGYLYASKVKGLDNPMVYGIEKLNEHNNAYFECECRAPTFPNYFKINEDGWQSIDPNSPFQF